MRSITLLLQVLEERFATISGYDIDIPTNFIFIGTMNPEDFTGTERLSEVFLDRFDVVYMDYPENEFDENTVLKESAKIRKAEVPERIYKFVAKFIMFLRNSPDIEKKPSVRAGIGLIERAAAHALLQNRNQVSLNDVKKHIISVLRHRIKLKPSLEMAKDVDSFLGQKLQEFMQRNEDFQEAGGEEGDVG